MIETETELGDPGPLRFGLSVGAVVPTGEAFYEVGDAPSFQLFAALPFEPFDEVRVGAGYSSHQDKWHDDNVGVTMIFVEALYAFGSDPMWLHVGPRVAYIHQDRAVFRNRMHGAGLGGMASLSRALGPRVTVNLSASLTGTFLPGTDWKDPRAPRDPDGWSNAWFRELRLGFTARPW